MISPHRRRQLWAGLAFALGSTLLVVAAVVSTANDALFDGPAFATRAAESLDDPGVADFLADAITDAVLAESPDLAAVRPLIRVTARGLVQLQPTRALTYAAARSAHGALFAEGSQRVLLSMPDIGLILRGAIAQASPELAERIPERLQAGLASYDGSRVIAVLSSVWGFRQPLKNLVWVLVALGAGSLILGVRLAPESYKGVTAAGLFLAGAGLLVVSFLPVGRAVAGSLLQEGGERAAVEGLWSAFMSPLSNIGLFLSGVGLLVSAAGLSLQDTFDPLEWAQRIGRALVVPPESASHRFIWATLMMALGGFLMAKPATALTVSAILTGMLVALLGTQEIFHTILESEPVKSVLPAGSVPNTYLRVGLVSLLVLVAVGALALVRSPVPVPPMAVLAGCNGHIDLCDRPLTQVVFPGAHNAMSNVSIPDWLFPHHEAGIAEQAQDGVRAFLIDVHYGFPGGSRIKTDMSGSNKIAEAAAEVLGPEGMEAAERIRSRLVGVNEDQRELFFCHGLCELGAYPLEPTLAQLREFLVRNPSEVIILVVEDYVAPEELAAAFDESGLSDYVYRGEPSAGWPTLRELVMAQENVVVFVESGTPGVPWLRPAFESIQETPYTFHELEEFNCRLNRGDTGNALFQINHWIETTPTPRPSNATVVNEYDFLLGRAQECAAERGRLPNIIAVDFYRTGDLVRVVETLNGFEAPPDPDTPEPLDPIAEPNR